MASVPLFVSVLLSATPRADMRELKTDLPETTESPYTVDAGHVQVEAEAASLERDDGETELFIATTNLKLGLTRASDVELIVEPYRSAPGVAGFGDTTLRAKLNLWGDDSGATAFGVMSFVTLPTAPSGLGAGHTEGGLILALGVEGPLDLDIATMLEVDAAYHDDHYGTDLVATCSVGHAVVGKLDAYVEVESRTPLDSPDELELLLNGGVIYSLADDAHLFGGTRKGVTAAAKDLALFVGGALRY